MPNLHEVVRSLESEFAKDRPKPLSLDELKAMHKLIKQSTEVLNSRLFVVLTAQEKGWNFARQVQFLENGNGENESYQKVAKEFNKRQQRKEDEREIRGGGRAKYNFKFLLMTRRFFTSSIYVDLMRVHVRKGFSLQPHLDLLIRVSKATLKGSREISVTIRHSGIMGTTKAFVSLWIEAV